jgi:hypothetical protein
VKRIIKNFFNFFGLGIYESLNYGYDFFGVVLRREKKLIKIALKMHLKKLYY